MPYYKRITYQHEAIKNIRSGIVHIMEQSIGGYGDFTACGKFLKKGFLMADNWKGLGQFTEFDGEITCRKCKAALARENIKFIKGAL